MDLFVNYTPYRPGPGVQQTGKPLPSYYGSAGIGERFVHNYKMALGPNFNKDPISCLARYQKLWHYYGIYTPEQIAREFAAPSKLLTFVILAADTESEDYMARYCGLVDDYRENMHRILARSLPVNRYASALWDPRFDPDVGFGVLPSTDDPRFEQKLSGQYQQPQRKSFRIWQ